MTTHQGSFGCPFAFCPHLAKDINVLCDLTPPLRSYRTLAFSPHFALRMRHTLCRTTVGDHLRPTGGLFRLCQGIVPCASYPPQMSSYAVNKKERLFTALRTIFTIVLGWCRCYNNIRELDSFAASCQSDFEIAVILFLDVDFFHLASPRL